MNELHCTTLYVRNQEKKEHFVCNLKRTRFSTSESLWIVRRHKVFNLLIPV